LGRPVAAAKPLLAGTAFTALVPLTSIAVPVIFVLVHAPRQIGWTRLGLFFVLAFAISWSYESLSIATGFPFGNYHYTEELGPKLGTVPLLIMPAYFGVCYISWLIARVLADHGRPAKRPFWLVAVVASFVMVMWDLSMDPARATVYQVWIWHDGGAYFGVPFVNFAGWFLCVLTIFLAYGAIAPRLSKPEPTDEGAIDALPLGLYAALFVEFVVQAAWPHQGTVTDAAGQVWNLADLYQSLGLVSIFTMGFVIVLALSKLTRSGAQG
jgi:uncharacterized membrane protein